VERRKRRARRSRLLYALLVVVSFIARHLPLSLLRFYGVVLGHFAWHVARRERRVALDNIAIAFPEWSARRRRATIRRMFQHLGQSAMEIIWLPNLNAQTLVRTTIFEGVEPILQLHRAGHGVVAFTGHCGNWEWLAYSVASLGLPVSVLQRERNEPHLNRFITSIRARAGIRTIDRGSTGAAREMMLAVRGGAVLAFLIDQNIRTESVKVPFFEKPALTPIGPAKLAIRTEAAVVSAFIERRGGKQYIRFNEPIETTRNDDPVALTALLTADIEEQIRRVPEQWVWFHQRWRERPEWEISERAVPSS
jgi:Kdo2-lipid IVA lauroyltransferase/acyltransferase